MKRYKVLNKEFLEDPRCDYIRTDGTWSNDYKGFNGYSINELLELKVIVLEVK